LRGGWRDGRLGIDSVARIGDLSWRQNDAPPFGGPREQARARSRTIMRVLIVQDVDEDPLTVLGSEIIDDGLAHLEQRVDLIVQRYNSRNARKAEGAVVLDAGACRGAIEFRLVGREVKIIEPRGNFRLEGSYVCIGSNNAYKFYGGYTSFAPGRETRWEARLYHSRKSFRYDSDLNSVDILARFAGALPNAHVDAVLLRNLAIDEIETAIEKWDLEQRGRPAPDR
jgi:hypothetical protein